jgi:ASC-1-like (ASCH) protein
MSTNHRIVFRECDRDKFEEIVDGTKTIETRAATAKYTSIKAGDELTFTCGYSEITKIVTKVEHFNSLEEMFSALPLNQILPSAKNIDDAQKVYSSFPGYKEKIETSGILAFHLSS